MKVIRVLKNDKAQGYGGIPADVPKAMGTNGLNTLTELINRDFDHGEWPQGILEDTMMPFKKKAIAVQCQDHRTISPASNVIMLILNERLQEKYENVLFGDDQFLFR